MTEDRFLENPQHPLPAYREPGPDECDLPDDGDTEKAIDDYVERVHERNDHGQSAKHS